MANLMYGVCVRIALGYCSIEWSQSSPNSFVVTGDPGIIPAADTSTLQIPNYLKFHMTDSNLKKLSNN